MGDRQGDITPGDDTEWISLGEAARRLSVSRAAVYGRVERGTLQSRPKGNRGMEVLWPPPQRHHNGKDDVALTVMGDVTSLLDELRERLGREVVELRGKLDAAQAQVADLRVELATARGEAAAKDAVLAEVRAQVEREIARGDALATQLDAARQPWWRRWRG